MLKKPRHVPGPSGFRQSQIGYAQSPELSTLFDNFCRRVMRILRRGQVATFRPSVANRRRPLSWRAPRGNLVAEGGAAHDAGEAARRVKDSGYALRGDKVGAQKWRQSTIPRRITRTPQNHQGG